MNRRFLKIQNYRNIGVTKDNEEFQTLYLNNTLNKDEMGELIILIGENNVGKSNILDAVNVIRPIENIKSIDLKKDIPDFMDYEDAKPRIKLIYADENESPEIEYFLDDNNKIIWNSNLSTNDLSTSISTSTKKLAINDKIKTKYDINFIPNILYYKEEEVKDSDLVTTPENIKNSKFFNALFRAVGKNISTIETAYEKAKKAPGHKNQYQNSINQNLKDIVSKKFNELYFQDLNTQEYNFYITLEKEQIYLSMEKNGNIILLEQQSVGFRWFFNFFFNFLYSNELNPGDIVLMDEPEIHLSIPGRRDLRNFIKKFARNHGITFITTTHNPSFIDIDYLDELRIVKFKKDKIGVEIQNDFSAIGEDEVDTLNEIVDSFGVLHRDIITNPNNKVIFVEGLIDYNYLTAFKKLKEAKENKKINLVFLPIHGLGKDNAEMNNKLKQLIHFREAIILTDSDERANLFKDASKSNSLMKERLTIFQLKEAEDQSFKEIESLFSNNDKERYKEMIQNKSGSLSSLFKNNILKRELDEQTINNFNKLLNYLSDMVLTDNKNNNKENQKVNQNS